MENVLQFLYYSQLRERSGGGGQRQAGDSHVAAERATEEGAGQADGARREERCLPRVHTQVLTAASTWDLT